MICVRRGDPLPKLTALAAQNMTRREREGLLDVARCDYNVRYDPRPDVEPVEFDDIGEDREGIWVRKHPEVILVDDFPELTDVVDAFQAGLSIDEEELAAPAFDALRWMQGTHERAVGRNLEEQSKRRGRR